MPLNEETKPNQSSNGGVLWNAEHTFISIAPGVGNLIGSYSWIK